jgi:hypothetical protein
MVETDNAGDAFDPKLAFDERGTPLRSGGNSMGFGTTFWPIPILL